MLRGPGEGKFIASLDYRLRYSLLLAVLSGIRQEEILPPLPPEQVTLQARQVFNLFAVFNMVAINLVVKEQSSTKHDCFFFNRSEEAEEYKRKLIQVQMVKNEL